ncbi:MAG: hypothetical protein GTN38_01460 [Candidatus Aenigmarchaeota archaeon]|nr:hypothetical protein [Candidatus Aenigmarchaeota archaeon]NIQ17529.1 hypothetical protein [Candidatus Aenigmarchaeota archaeon]NIS73107.1 hypothetical protein [Candidatus Aenigmarchaeota archaeon]
MKYGISSKKFNLTNFSFVALIFIIVGIVVNIGGSLFSREIVGQGNFFIMWGFIIAVIGLFVHFLRQRW